MTTRRPSISVVYPMFNEEENIERAVHFAEAVLTDMTSDYEILIVNDASTDRSGEIAEALARSNRKAETISDLVNSMIRTARFNSVRSTGKSASQ